MIILDKREQRRPTPKSLTKKDGKETLGIFGGKWFFFFVEDFENILESLITRTRADKEGILFSRIFFNKNEV